MSGPCRFTSGFKTVTWPEWSKRHVGHKVTLRKIKAPYPLYLYRCSDCAASYVTDKIEGA